MTTDSAQHPTYQLLVDRDELAAALRQIAAFKRRNKGGRVRLTFTAPCHSEHGEESVPAGSGVAVQRIGELAIHMPQVTIRVSARGTWPTEVFTRSAWLWALAAVPPDADPLAFIYDGRDLRVGTTVVPVTSAKGTP